MYIEGRSIRNTIISALREVHARRDDVRYFKRSIIGAVRYLKALVVSHLVPPSHGTWVRTIKRVFSVTKQTACYTLNFCMQ